jgi:hypothetical protein
MMFQLCVELGKGNTPLNPINYQAILNEFVQFRHE